jgi:hypothetical protein
MDAPLPSDPLRPTRRTFLTGAAALGTGALLLPTLTACTPPNEPAGYTRLAFFDDFDSIATIDTAATKAPGYKWYASQWFGFPTTPADNIRVADSVLTLGGGTPTTGTGAALETAISRPGGGAPYHTGTVFGGGAYFEARIAFDPADTPAANRHWPCFWSMSIEHVWHTANPAGRQWPGQPDGYAHFAELDFFEAFTTGGRFGQDRRWYLGGIHDWSGTYVADTGWQYNIQNSGNNRFDVGSVPDWNRFHTYGCLWVPQQDATPGYVRWYFDNIPGPVIYWKGPIGSPPLPGQGVAGTPMSFTPDTAAEADRTYAILDQHRHALVLGTDYGWPMRVDWVKVWQKPT